MITMGTVVPGPNLRGHPSSSGFSEGGVGVGNFQTIEGCCQFAGRVAEQSGFAVGDDTGVRSEEHTSELQSLMRISYAVFCLKKKKNKKDMKAIESIVKNIT